MLLLALATPRTCCMICKTLPYLARAVTTAQIKAGIAGIKVTKERIDNAPQSKTQVNFTLLTHLLQFGSGISRSMGSGWRAWSLR